MIAREEKGIAILRDGVFVHEAEAICRSLEKAGIPFGVRQVSQEDAGIVDQYNKQKTQYEEDCDGGSRIRSACRGECCAC